MEIAVWLNLDTLASKLYQILMNLLKAKAENEEKKNMTKILVSKLIDTLK